MEGATNLGQKGKQLVHTDFHPEIAGFEPNLFIGASGAGSQCPGRSAMVESVQTSGRNSLSLARETPLANSGGARAYPDGAGEFRSHTNIISRARPLH